MFGLDRFADLAPQAATLVFSNEDLNYIMKIIKYLKESGLLIKSLTETIRNKAEGQKDGFLGILLGTLGASLLGNMLAGKRVMKAGEDTIRAAEETIRAGQDFYCCLIR